MARTTIGREATAIVPSRRVGIGASVVSPKAFALLLVAAVALALRLWPLRHFSLDFQDEGAYWQSLRALAAGQPLFSVVFSSQPPFFLLGLLPFYLLFGGTLVAARLGVALYSLLGLAAVYYIGRAVASRWAGVLACALLAVDPLYLVESRTLQAEMPSEALALAGVALAAVAMRQRGAPRRWRAAASGVAIGLGVLTKLFDIAALVPAALYLAAPIFAAWRDGRGHPSPSASAGGEGVRRALRPVIPDLALLAAGALVACAVVLAPYIPVRGLVYDQVVRFHQVAQQTGFGGSTGWHANLSILRDTVAEYVPAPYLLLALAAILLAAWRRAWAVAPLLVWLVFSLGLLVQQRPLLWHHVVLLAPLLALLGGAALPLAVTPLTPGPSPSRGEGRHPGSREEGRHPGTSPSPPPRPRTVAPRLPHSRVRERGPGGEGLLALAILTLVAASALAALWSSVGVDRSAVDPNPPPAAVQLRMAAALRDRTRPGELVVTDGQYVAGLADRGVPGELVDTSFVRIDAGMLDPRYFSTPWLEGIIARDHVRTILFATDRLKTVPGFRAWVERHYRLVESFGGDRALYQR